MAHFESLASNSGAIVVASRRGDLGGVVRCVQYGTGALQVRGQRSAHLRSPRAAVVWGARYSAGVLANGWEPFDQPTPALYMPHSYAAFERTSLGTGDVFLLQRRRTIGPLQAEFVAHADDGVLFHVPHGERHALRAALLRCLDWVGVPEQQVAGFSEQLAGRSDMHVELVA